MQKIIVHSGAFHADELVAIAILIAFKIVKKDVIIIRTRDEAVIKEAKENKDFIIDVGAEFDGITKFDHHHDRTLKSSAGLIWDFVKTQIEGTYESIDRLVHIVDQNDVGIKKSGEFEFSSLVSNYNGSFEKADENFMDALVFVQRTIDSLKRESEGISKAKAIIDESTSFVDSRFLMLKEFTRQWDFFLNGDTTFIQYICWEDKNQGVFKIQVVPLEYGSFELSAPALIPDESMVFIHNNGFFGVAATEEILKQYIIKNL